jgi:alcohol dehydrogenase
MNQQQAYQFTIPQNVHFGLGSLKKLPDFLKDNASDHVFLISDHGLESIGLVKKIKDIINLYHQAL